MKRRIGAALSGIAMGGGGAMLGASWLLGPWIASHVAAGSALTAAVWTPLTAGVGGLAAAVGTAGLSFATWLDRQDRIAAQSWAHGASRGRDAERGTGWHAERGVGWDQNATRTPIPERPAQQPYQGPNHTNGLGL